MSSTASHPPSFSFLSSHIPRTPVSLPPADHLPLAHFPSTAAHPRGQRRRRNKDDRVLKLSVCGSGYDDLSLSDGSVRCTCGRCERWIDRRVSTMLFVRRTNQCFGALSLQLMHHVFPRSRHSTNPIPRSQQTYLAPSTSTSSSFSFDPRAILTSPPNS